MHGEKLVELAKDVAEKRQEFEDAKQEKVSAERVLAETKEGKHLQWCVEDLANEQAVLSKAEDQLKSAVLEAYNETKERKPIDKVEVKIFKSLEYDALKALDWCRAFAPTLLAINKKLFEKMAPDMGAPVKVIETAKCTIAKDLSMYLDKKEVQDARKELPPKV